MTPDDPRQVLDVSLEAGDEEIRAAYLRKVKEYPPDRAPREFEKVRDAYELLRDPRRRTRQMLLSADPNQPLVSLLEGRFASERRFLRSGAVAGGVARKQIRGEEPWDRGEILQRFEQWLDVALAEEGPPQGIPAEILSGDAEPEVLAHRLVHDVGGDDHPHSGGQTTRQGVQADGRNACRRS